MIGLGNGEAVQKAECFCHGTHVTSNWHTLVLDIEGLPPNPALDASGEWSEGVGNRSERHGTRYSSLMDDLPDLP